MTMTMFHSLIIAVIAITIAINLTTVLVVSSVITEEEEGGVGDNDHDNDRICRLSNVEEDDGNSNDNNDSRSRRSGRTSDRRRKVTGYIPDPNIANEESDECTVYMAPSTIGDHSNLGIFTAAPISLGQIVPYPEILIPLLWRPFGTHPTSSFGDGKLFDRYIWEQYVGGRSMEPFDDLHPTTTEVAAMFVPGVGCTVNSMLDLSNIYSVKGSEFDDVVSRDDPGTGAFTPYHSAPTKAAVKYIPAGAELFASYGSNWIPWIPDVAVTLDESFDQADELMNDFEEWIQQHESNAAATADAGRGGRNTNIETELTDDVLKAMWEFLVNFPHYNRPMTVLPKEWNRTYLQMNEGRSSSREYFDRRGRVSIEFLKEHGRCQDHIRPGLSAIPHAGRGAFASRDLEKGTIVAHAPLIHVAVRGEEIFQVEYGEGVLSNKTYIKQDLVRQ
jgi:hypothetical protein